MELRVKMLIGGIVGFMYGLITAVNEFYYTEPLWWVLLFTILILKEFILYHIEKNM